MKKTFSLAVEGKNPARLLTLPNTKFANTSSVNAAALCRKAWISGILTASLALRRIRLPWCT